MDTQNDEITLEDFKNYIEDISKFMAHQQIESGRYFSEFPDESKYEFRSLKDEN